MRSSKSIARIDAPAPAARGADTRRAVVGDRVVIGGLGLEGDRRATCTTAKRKSKCAASGSARTLSELRVLDGAPPKPEPAPVRVNVQLQPRDGASSSELLLVGNTVDQAIDRLEKFLDESLLGEQRTLRLIHGFGTGRLKEAVVEFLHKHPLVTQRAHRLAAGRRRRGDDRGVERLKIGRLQGRFRVIQI